MRRILNLFSIYSWECNELAQVVAQNRESFRAWRHSWQNRSYITNRNEGKAGGVQEGAAQNASMHLPDLPSYRIQSRHADTHTHAQTYWILICMQN